MGRSNRFDHVAVTALSPPFRPRPPMILSRAAVLLAGCLTLLPARAGLAAELLMLERAGCPYCARFDAEIGRVYDKTDEARRAPLRRIDIEKPVPEGYAFALPERITPTFVLVDDGREIARLRGYPGQDFFWGMLAAMLEKLPK